MAAGNTVKLRSSDGEVFEVDQEVAFESVTVKNTVEDMTDSDSAPVPLANVSTKVLQKVIEYCTYHVASRRETAPDRQTKAANWNKEYILKTQQETLFDLIQAANYMNIQGLLDITTRELAQQVKGKTPEELRALFNIKNDFTPEEEEKVRCEHQWALD